MKTVGRLAKQFGLSRSTLLYYEKRGLLVPTGHSKGEYRYYTPEDELRLQKICTYKKAGVSLKKIQLILESTNSAELNTLTKVLESRLTELAEDMEVLRRQQALITKLLGTQKAHEHTPQSVNDAARKIESEATMSPALDKALWTKLLSLSGFSEEDMLRWHKDFEQTAPDKHELFLQSLGIAPDERKAIRKASAAPSPK